MIPLPIVILDSHALNPGDLSWSELELLGPCTFYPRTPPDQILSRIENAGIVLTNKTPLRAETIQAAQNLRYIGVLARGIVVTNVPAYGTMAVAQHTFALILELTQQIGLHAHSVRAGDWSRSPEWCYWLTDLTELAGRKLGLIGAGRIAQAVATIGRAFGMEVDFATRSGGPAQLEKVLRESDVISLHCPLTPDTSELINAMTLRLVKPTAYLINTGRGQLIRENDLAEGLNAGRLAGAALDVLSAEPPPPDHPLVSARNCIITPHVAWAARAARTRLLHIAVQNMRSFIAQQPQNVVA